MKNKKLYLTVILSIILVSGCAFYDNFTTYFNTYYNIERIMKEAEMEFEYQDEKLRTTPKVYVPDPMIGADNITGTGTPSISGKLYIKQAETPAGQDQT